MFLCKGILSTKIVAVYPYAQPGTIRFAMKLPDFKKLIVFENDNYLLVNKPANLATLSERHNEEAPSLLASARHYDENLQIGHRLDKETTGILAVAKQPEAYRHLAIQFEKRKVLKIYHAVAEGLHNFTDKNINHPLTTLKKGQSKIDYESGKTSETVVNTLEAFRFHTLLSCQPLTGRLHQIRIHLSSARAPLVSDLQYGGKMFYLSKIKKRFNLKRFTEEEPLMRRVALHAFSLEFSDLNGDKIYAEAPYPKDFGALLRQLRLHSYVN